MNTKKQTEIDVALRGHAQIIVDAVKQAVVATQHFDSTPAALQLAAEAAMNASVATNHLIAAKLAEFVELLKEAP